MFNFGDVFGRASDVKKPTCWKACFILVVCLGACFVSVMCLGARLSLDMGALIVSDMLGSRFYFGDVFGSVFYFGDVLGSASDDVNKQLFCNLVMLIICNYC